MLFAHKECDYLYSIYNCMKCALKKDFNVFEEVSFVKKMLMNACLIPVKMEEPALMEKMNSTVSVQQVREHS